MKTKEEVLYYMTELWNLWENGPQDDFSFVNWVRLSLESLGWDIVQAYDEDIPESIANTYDELWGEINNVCDKLQG